MVSRMKTIADRDKPITDKFGVIREAAKILPTDELRVALVHAIAELEDNEAHRTQTFPRTRLHKVTGIKQAIYRADITKISGWRLHLQYGSDKMLHLKDIVDGDDHDRVIGVIKAKIARYD